MEPKQINEQLESQPEELINTQQSTEISDIPQGIQAEQAYRMKWKKIVGALEGALLLDDPQDAELGEQL